MFKLIGKKIIAGFNEIFMLSSLHEEGVRGIEGDADIQIQGIIFLISALKHMLWVLKNTASMRRFF